MSQEHVSLPGNLSVGARHELPFRLHLQLLGYQVGHHVDIVNGLLARPCSILDLVLAQKDLKADVSHSLAVETLDISDKLLFTFVNLLEELNFVFLEL